MILTCPSCSKRFVLAARLLAPEGRTVKCSSCAEEWFQLPDPDELIEDLEEQMEEGGESQADTTTESSDSEEKGEEGVAQNAEPENIPEDIPEAVKPKPLKRAEPIPEEPTDNRQAIGFAAATGVFVLILGVLLLMKGPLVKAWPASAALYQMVGMDVKLVGEGLVFDRIQVDVSKDYVTVDGLIINLKSFEQGIPMLKAIIKDTKGEEVASWFIEVPEKTIESEGTLKFKAQYEGHFENIETVTLGFVLKP